MLFIIYYYKLFDSIIGAFRKCYDLRSAVEMYILLLQLIIIIILFLLF